MLVFPFAVPTDGRGRMLDDAQGVYARSLARTLVERLSTPPRIAARLAALTSDGPLEGDSGPAGHGWVVASEPWTLDEACKVGLPKGTEYLLHGSAELTDRVRLRIYLVDSPGKQLALDHVVLRPRDELFAALDEAAVSIARALGESVPQGAWPTRDVEAFLAYLRGRDMSAAHEAGVRVQDPEKSFDPYLEAARRDPQFIEAQDRLVALAMDFALCGRGPIAAARTSCERLLAIDPTAYKAHAAIAEMDLLAGDGKAAEGRLMRALQLAPAWTFGLERMGTALLRQGRFGEAVAWFERALSIRSDNLAALQGLGAALAECGRVDEAVRAFERAISLGAESAEAHDALALLLPSLGRNREARAHRRQSRLLLGKPRAGLYLLRDAWEWLFGGTHR
jgi:tetratricopeptide (TPR) repeat protein